MSILALTVSQVLPYCFVVANQVFKFSRLSPPHSRPHCLQRHSGSAQRRLSTAGSAAHGNSISHDKFMRDTAAVAPNRKLYVGIFQYFGIRFDVSIVLSD
jgi:hypothetical protein